MVISPTKYGDNKISFFRHAQMASSIDKQGFHMQNKRKQAGVYQLTS